MTTKPKAKKFRIRRNPNMPVVQQNPDYFGQEDEVEDGFGGRPFPTAAAADEERNAESDVPEALLRT